MFHQKSLHGTWCMSRHILWWSCQSPFANSCGLLNHLNSFCRGVFKLNRKFDADLWLYLLSHFECSIHTVHMHYHTSPIPTDKCREVITVYACSFQSTLLASRLHHCHTNCSPYINCSRQTLYGESNEQSALNNKINTEAQIHGTDQQISEGKR